MGWFRRKERAVAAFWKALEAGDARGVEAALGQGASANDRRPRDGMTPIRHALREEHLAVVAILLRHEACLDAEAVGSMALWAERAQRSLRHGHPHGQLMVNKARLAIQLMNQNQAPWDLGVPSLGSGDSARFAINHVFPGCLAPTSG